MLSCERNEYCTLRVLLRLRRSRVNHETLLGKWTLVLQTSRSSSPIGQGKSKCKDFLAFLFFCGSRFACSYRLAKPSHSTQQDFKTCQERRYIWYDTHTMCLSTVQAIIMLIRVTLLILIICNSYQGSLSVTKYSVTHPSRNTVQYEYNSWLISLKFSSSVVRTLRIYGLG